MFFDDWKCHPDAKLNPALLWEYDLSSPDWDWNRMATTVAARVLERGYADDYYALFHLYGNPDTVKQIIRQIPYLSAFDLNWACVLFHLQKEDMHCYKRMLSRQKRLSLSAN